ncbi:hypothetical protein [Dyadobacter sp. 32]
MVDLVAMIKDDRVVDYGVLFLLLTGKPGNGLEVGQRSRFYPVNPEILSK